MPRMGRVRIHRKDLPRGVSFEHGAYYFRGADRKRKNLGREYGEAIRLYAELVQPVTGRQNVSAIMDAYAADKIPGLRPRTQQDYYDALRRLRPVFGAMWPEDIEPSHIYQYLRARVGKVRANREVAVLSNVMQQAIEMGLLKANPCKQVRRNKESAKTEEVTDRQVEEFMPHCPEWLQAYIGVKELIGLRQGDMLKLGEFNVRDDGLFSEVGKTGKRLLFAWTPALRTAVDRCRQLRRRPSEARFFPISASGFKSAWTRAQHSYQPDDVKARFSENALRAKVATQAHGMGMNATSLLDHSTDAVTRRHYIRGTRKVQPLK